MRRFYKFSDDVGANYILGGSLRFGRLNYYRIREVFDGLKGIGDLNEGVRTTISSGFELNNDSPHALRKSLNDAGVINALDGVNLRVTGGMRITRAIDCFVFSISFGPIDRLTAEMCFRDGPNPYWRCIQVSSAQALMELVRDTGTINGVPISDIFHVDFGRVVYQPIAEHDLLSDFQVQPADPFLKSPDFEDQREWRIVLYPKAPVTGDAVNVDVSLPNGLLWEHEIVAPEGWTAPESYTVGPADREAAIDAFEAALGAWVAKAEEMRTPSDFSEGWMERARILREAEERAFLPFQADIIKAYEGIRDYLDRPWLDDPILSDLHVAGFVMRGRTCLMHLGRRGW